MKIRIFIVIVVILSIATAFLVKKKQVFPDLEGPMISTAMDIITSSGKVQLGQYSAGGKNSMSVLLNDSNSSWLGLANALKSIGIPFQITSSAEEALQHNVVMVYPSLTGANTSPATLRNLAEHVRSGGTLIAFSVVGGGMSQVFGFEDSVEGRPKQKLVFNDLEFTQRFSGDDNERTILLGGGSDEGFPATGFLNPRHAPIAKFGDNTAAIVHNNFDGENVTGHAYAIGIDIGHFAMRAYNGRFSGSKGAYVNEYRPDVDIFLRFIKEVYRQGEPDAVTVYPTPFDREFTVLLTHDIDFTVSMDNVSQYAEYENLSGIPATYFIQAKYVKDYNDDLFFKPSRKGQLEMLRSYGFEIGSHTVSHSNEFRSMTMGDGKERYPDYKPFVKTFDQVNDASILGELRISKFLLEELSGARVISFRPGHLSLPEKLPEVLVATGYLNSSSITANEARTHLPYRMMFGRGYENYVDIYEFPVTIEDESGNLNERFQDAVNLSEKISRFRGLVNILIHTDMLGQKMQFEKRYIEKYSDRAWFSTMNDYADWWRARAELKIDINKNADGIELLLETHRSVDGLTLQIPASWKLDNGPAGTVQHADRLVIGEFDRSTKIRINYQ